MVTTENEGLQSVAPPKYWFWADKLHRQIREGELRPGDRLPSVREMNREHGVSRPVMDRVHALLEREKLIVREPGRGVFVATPETPKSTGVLGVSIPAELQEHPYYARLLRGIQRVGREEGAEILLTHESSEIRWAKMDGMVLAAPHRNLLDRLPPGMPAVSLLHEIDGISSVVTDDFEAVKTLVSHLTALGHQKIAMISSAFRRMEDRDVNSFAYSLSHSRANGYFAALQAARIAPRPEWTQAIAWCESPSGGDIRDEFLGAETMRRWLRDGWRETGCTALVAPNDGMAIGVIGVLDEAGFKVPRDVSVTGFDGIYGGNHFRPRLTTVKVPLEEIGAHGARMLLRQINAPMNLSASREAELAHIEPYVVSSVFEVGESCAPLKGE